MIWRDSLGSDVSLLAAWDASLPALSSDQQAEYDWVGESEAGEVFLVALGEESQAHMTIVFGEPWPTDFPPLFCSAKQPYLLHLPSGRLRLDSSEFYREIDPALVGPEDVAIVPPGNYLIHCHIAFFPGAFHGKASDVIGADDYAYYRSKTGGVACPVGCTLMLGAAIALLGFQDWITAIAAMLGVLVCWVIENTKQFRRKTDERFTRVAAAIAEYEANRAPHVLLELRLLGTEANPNGGTFDLTAAFADAGSDQPRAKDI